ncbi:hypothetical protein EVAR_52884_1 [Eumeta japonica]|uniref:Uncharacterized protein n=1 Tax=Eumeta variegata TaxID=151549 RepID=A0A4C1YID3_EUMVA|nr:hypothetical protein EVAR_52884_1 [Eumeta japonica]
MAARTFNSSRGHCKTDRSRRRSTKRLNEGTLYRRAMRADRVKLSACGYTRVELNDLAVNLNLITAFNSSPGSVSDFVPDHAFDLTSDPSLGFVSNIVLNFSPGFGSRFCTLFHIRSRYCYRERTTHHLHLHNSFTQKESSGDARERRRVRGQGGEGVLILVFLLSRRDIGGGARTSAPRQRHLYT